MVTSRRPKVHRRGRTKEQSAAARRGDRTSHALDGWADPFAGYAARQRTILIGEPNVTPRARDLLAASPLLALYAIGAVGGAAAIARELGGAGAPTAALCLLVASQALTIAFFVVQVALVLVRRLALKTAPGLAPRAAAMAGLLAPALFAVLPRAQMGPWRSGVSAALIALGMAASIWVVARLGRSFSIVPQARALVTRGPYRWIRHPLYLAEQIATTGVMLQFVQPYGALLSLAALVVQIPRMHFEEQVLAGSFPAYADYMRRTRRLVPGLY